jgi:micrococcal nuclease
MFLSGILLSFGTLVNIIVDVTVTRVIDGDTVKAKLKHGEEITIRLASLDAPELAQEYGKESKKYLESLLLPKKVTLRTYEMDFYKRVLGDLNCNGFQINSEMILKGWAWSYMPKNKKFISYESQARKLRAGLWAGKNPIAPWEFRRLKKVESILNKNSKN